MKRTTALIIGLSISCFSFGQYKSTGIIERIDPALDQVIDKSSKADIIAEGFEWSEGPLWIKKYKMLLFSDVPTNTIYKWTEANGKEIYLRPSGYSGTSISKSKEPGSNGLLLDTQGNLVLCQHGNRQMAVMETTIDKPEPRFLRLAYHYKGKRFSSPNDAVYNRQGDLFFSDPPYGLPMQNDNDPEKEIPFNGVYNRKKNGVVALLTDSITRPNGIAFFPGEKQLIIACSDPAKPNWYIYDVVDGDLKNGKIFYTARMEKGGKGLPDGLKINSKGIVFATGPGGIWIFNRNAVLLGKIKLDEAASNVALSDDEKTLFITNDMRVLRIGLK
ncbi:MAG TPA: gluconolactonase [Chitinophagaceae bacterium]|nr:gluconolactonase [Chitinophagaceae bacterium]